jgi:hypothetical protein
MIKMYIGLNIQYRLFLSDFNETWIFSTDFRKLLNCKINWKSVHWESSCFMRTDGQIDMKKLMVAFQNFAKALKDSPHFMEPEGSLPYSQQPATFPCLCRINPFHAFPNDFFKIQLQRLKKTYENCYTV